MPKPKTKAKVKPKFERPLPKSNIQFHDKTSDDMRRFHAALDFSGMWHDFYLDVDDNNSPKWKSVRRFVKMFRFKDNPLNEMQTDFLNWLLGPQEPVDEEMVKLYGESFKPQNWEKRREDGGWFSDASLRDYSKSVRQKINALDALQECGNGITIHALSRISKMMEQLDTEMKGSFFAPNLSAKENVERAKLYVELQGKLLNMLEQAQGIYAQSHGINFRDMSGFESFMAAALMMQNRTGGPVAQQSNSDRVLGRLIEMTLEKGVNHGIPLPDEIKKTAVAVMDSPQKKKDRLN